MMVYHSLAQVPAPFGCAVALGNFDGVHIGHQALFAEAKRWGPPAALTFDPHPGKVLQPDLAPKLITPLPRKLELMEAQGLEAVIVQPFTEDFAKTPREAFERELLQTLEVKHLVVGPDFTYGDRRLGTVASLGVAAKSVGATLHMVRPQTVDGVVASSSRIREYILEGRVLAARRLLGRFFDLDGVVVRGAGRGRKIGFPTANVDTLVEVRPAPGVYAVRATVLGEGLVRPGAANIGVKPTFGGTTVTIEVHLLDFDGDLYGKTLRVEFMDRLRPEQRFGSVDELRAQINKDVDQARATVARLVG